jgi:hypothetical protein
MTGVNPLLEVGNFIRRQSDTRSNRFLLRNMDETEEGAERSDLTLRLLAERARNQGNDSVLNSAGMSGDTPGQHLLVSWRSDDRSIWSLC